MTNIFKRFPMVLLMALLMALFVFPSIARAQNQVFENKNVSITSVFPPQYLGWAVVLGSTTQTVPWYYKVSAVVPGITETAASAVTTAYSQQAPLSSTNTLRLMWAPVNGATSYKLYKSVDNSSFYLLASVDYPLLTYVDDGSVTLATAYATPSQITGNLAVENNITISNGVIYLARTASIRGTIVPTQSGGQIYDSTSNLICVSTSTNKYSWVEAVSTSTACPH